MKAFFTGVFYLLTLLLLLAAGAIWYFSSPSIPRAALEAKYATPPSQFIVLADGARVHYRDRGPKGAPVLLLIHGSNDSLFTWEPWAQRLSSVYRVVSVDLPGHGLTGAVPNGDYSQEGMTEFVREFADRLGLAKFVIAGNSMGGGVAARFAEEYPARLSALILVDAGGMRTGPGDHRPLIFTLARIPLINQIFLRVTPRALVVEGLNDAIVHKAVIDDAIIDRFWEMARMEGSRAATLARFSLPMDGYVAAHVREIKAPTLILWGEQDHLIPVAAGRQFHAAIPGSKLIIYPATGHVPMLELPDESANDVQMFLEGRAL